MRSIGGLRPRRASRTDYNYMIQVRFGSVDETCEVWFRYQDANNGYVVRYTKLAKHKLYLFEVVNGQWTQLDSDDYDTGAQTQNLKIKANGTSLKVWYDGTLELNVTDGTHAAGGVVLDSPPP